MESTVWKALARSNKIEIEKAIFPSSKHCTNACNEVLKSTRQSYRKKLRIKFFTPKAIGGWYAIGSGIRTQLGAACRRSLGDDIAAKIKLFSGDGVVLVCVAHILIDLVSDKDKQINAAQKVWHQTHANKRKRFVDQADMQIPAT